MKSCLQPRAAGLPSQILQPAFSEAGGLHPVQDIACPSPVVMHKPGIPEKRERQRYDRVDEDETGHRGWVPLCEQIVLLIDATAQGEETKKTIASRMVQDRMGHGRFRFVAGGGSGRADGVLQEGIDHWRPDWSSVRRKQCVAVFAERRSGYKLSRSTRARECPVEFG